MRAGRVPSQAVNCGQPVGALAILSQWNRHGRFAETAVADIFISYANADRDQARLLAAFLEAEGYSVWWDTSLLSGEAFRKVIMTELGRARAAIVIWTEHSINSDWVQSEAGRAHADRKLIPVKAKALAYPDIPPPFDNMHIEDVYDREKITAAVTALLSKPESSLAALDRFSKRARFEFLSWFGLVGGILTLATHIQSAITVARWARQLLGSWTAILVYVWTHILFFLPRVEKADAIIMTLVSLIIVNILSCARWKNTIEITRQRSCQKWTQAAVWSLLIFGVFVAGNPRLTSPTHIGIFIIYLSRPVLDFIVWSSDALAQYLPGMKQDNTSLTMWFLWTYLFLMSSMPLVVLYFVVSRAVNVRLNPELLSYRLSRIVIGLAVILALNYLAVWWDLQT
jgi:TIR domain